MSSPRNPPCDPQGTTDADRAYAGSTYREVRDAVFANPYYQVWGRLHEDPPLPTHHVGFWTLFRGFVWQSLCVATLPLFPGRRANRRCPVRLAMGF